MSSEPLEPKDARAEYFARWEAVEAFKAQEHAGMTEEPAWEIIRTLPARWGLLIWASEHECGTLADFGSGSLGDGQAGGDFDWQVKSCNSLRSRAEMIELGGHAACGGEEDLRHLWSLDIIRWTRGARSRKSWGQWKRFVCRAARSRAMIWGWCAV
jgi:hypothetical protein